MKESLCHPAKEGRASRRLNMTSDFGTTRASAGPRNEKKPRSMRTEASRDGNPTLRVRHFPLDETASATPQSIRSRWSLVTPVVPQVSPAGLPAYTSIRNRAATI
jgi:hypothetical protein